MNPDISASNLETSIRGFIITRQWLEADTGTELVFWAASGRGPLRCVFTNQECVFFLASTDREKAEALLADSRGWRCAITKLQTFQQVPVVGFYFNSQRLLYNSKDLLQSNDIVVFEADVNPTDRFLMERFITGGIEVKGVVADKGSFLEVVNPAIRSTDYRPALRCVSIDIETSYAGEELYSIGIYSETESVVYMVDKQHSVPDTQSFLRLCPDETTVIRHFLSWIEHYDPDVLIGWNVVNFDLRFLSQCCERLKMNFKLGRNDEVVKWRRVRDGNDKLFALVPGRVVLDGIELMRSATYQFENFSLDHVARQLLDRGKLIDDVDQRGVEINKLFHDNKMSLAEYNIEDCKLVWDIFKQEQLSSFAIERSVLTGLELNRYGGSVAAFDFLYLPQLHRSGYVAPSLEKINTRSVSPGGYVMDSVPGIYDHVIVLDFKSLYPSIIRTFHIDPLALVVGANESDPIAGFDGGLFSREHHLLPRLIENLWQARDRAKASSNFVLSQAIKIIMNSFYGVLGTKGCRFFDTRLVSSITKRGHQIIIDSKNYIEEMGYPVIYGDTDSVFVHVGSDRDSSVEQIGKEISEGLNDWWTQRLLNEMRLTSCLEIEFDTHFHRFLMPTIRGSDTGSKKRYAGLVKTGQGERDFRLIFKGLETVRSDWTPLARKFQQELYERIFLELPYEDYIKETVAKIVQGHYESELVFRRRIRRQLKDYVKNVPPHIQAARKAAAIRNDRGLPDLFENGKWVEYFMTVNGPEPRQYRQAAIDYDFYIERQIAPIADSILVFKSTSMKELLDKQMNLF